MNKNERAEMDRLREKANRTEAEEKRYRELLTQYLEETLVAYPHEED